MDKSKEVRGLSRRDRLQKEAGVIEEALKINSTKLLEKADDRIAYQRSVAAAARAERQRQARLPVVVVEDFERPYRPRRSRSTL